MKQRQSLYLIALLLLLSGCVTVRIIEEKNSTRPEDTSQSGATDIPLTISPSPMMISTATKTKSISPTFSPSPMMISTAWKEIQIPQPALKTDTWYFLAVTRQGRTNTLYLDGRAISFGDFDILNLDTPISLKFGRREGYQGEYLNGRIDEVEIYNGTALTPQQIYMLYSAGSSGKCKGTNISNCVPPPVGLTSWWPGEDKGAELVSQRTGFLREDATTGTGLVGGAFEFDGDHEYFEVPDDPALNFGTRDFTVDLWVNFNDLSGSQVMVEKWIQEDGYEHLHSQGWTLFVIDNKIWFVWEDGITEGGLWMDSRPYSTATPTIIPTAPSTVTP